MRTLSWVAALAAVTFSSPALAAETGHSDMQGDAQAGKQLVLNGKPDNPMVQPCKTCHGENGAGQAMAKFPRLAGQNPRYMVKQLKDFAAGERGNYPFMTNLAKGLSEEDMWNASAYYAQQEAPISGGEASGQVLDTGERIATRGIPAADVPACTSCHGPEGKGVPPVFPQIAGQHASYIQKQLSDWKTGKRANDPAQMMKDVAPALSAKQMEAVAAYFSQVGAGS